MAHLNSLAAKITIYSAKKTQITLLLFPNIIILAKYFDFMDIFLKKLVKILLKYIKTNRSTIKLKVNKQLLYKSIYSLGQIKIEIFKIYIEINLAHSFITLLKLLAGIFYLFIQKFEHSFYLCINYQKFNNFILKNKYRLHLIKKFLY